MADGVFKEIEQVEEVMILQSFQDQFTRLSISSVSDGIGGTTLTIQTGVSFIGFLGINNKTEKAEAGKTETETAYILLCPRDISLVNGDILRRKSDGAEFRVFTDSERKTPKCSSMNFSAVDVKRYTRPT